MARADIVIAGGGPVGSALALALEGTGLEVVLAEPRPAPDPRLRPVALSHGSRLILERLNAFDPGATTPIETIHVSQAGGFGRTLITSDDQGVPALGYVCDLRELAAALAAATAAHRTAARVASWTARGDAVTISLESDEGPSEIDARLLVLADGGRSAGPDPTTREYGQSAIVALVRSERMPRGVAWERFTGEGPLALLPFAHAGATRYALVWTVRTERAGDLVAGAAPAFLAALERSFGARLGHFVETGARDAYPLSLRVRRNHTAAARVVAIGNAAQMLHPVAGQGLNLGLRDAFELAEIVRRTSSEALGDRAFLARVHAARMADRRASVAVTDSLVRVFTAALPGFGLARGLGLAALDVIPPARRFLARRMMFGVRGIP